MNDWKIVQQYYIKKNVYEAHVDLGSYLLQIASVCQGLYLRLQPLLLRSGDFGVSVKV